MTSLQTSRWFVVMSTMLISLLLIATTALPIYTHNPDPTTPLPRVHPDLFGIPMSTGETQYVINGSFQGSDLMTTPSSAFSITLQMTSSDNRILSKLPSIISTSLQITDLTTWDVILVDGLVPVSGTPTLITFETTTQITINLGQTYLIHLVTNFSALPTKKGDLKKFMEIDFSGIQTGLVFSGGGGGSDVEWRVQSPLWMQPQLGRQKQPISLQHATIRSPFPMIVDDGSTHPIHRVAIPGFDSTNAVISQIDFALTVPSYLDRPEEADDSRKSSSFTSGQSQYIGIYAAGIGFLTTFGEVKTKCFINKEFMVSVYQVPDSQYFIFDLSLKLRDHIKATGSNILSFSCDVSRFAFISPKVLTDKHRSSGVDQVKLVITPIYLDPTTNALIQAYSYGHLTIPFNLAATIDPLNRPTLTTGSSSSLSNPTGLQPPSIHFLDRRRNGIQVSCQFDISYPNLGSTEPLEHIGPKLDSFQFRLPILRQTDGSDPKVFVSVTPSNRDEDIKSLFAAENSFTTSTQALQYGVIPPQAFQPSVVAEMVANSDPGVGGPLKEKTYRVSVMASGTMNTTSFNNNDSLCQLIYSHRSSDYNQAPVESIVMVGEATMPIIDMWDYAMQRNETQRPVEFELTSITQPNFAVHNPYYIPIKSINIWLSGGSTFRVADPADPSVTAVPYATVECLGQNGLKSQTTYRCAVESVKVEGNWLRIGMVTTLYKVYALKFTLFNVSYIDTVAGSNDFEAVVGDSELNRSQVPGLFSYPESTPSSPPSSPNLSQDVLNLIPLQNAPASMIYTSVKVYGAGSNGQSNQYFSTLAVGYDQGQSPVSSRGRPNSTQDRLGVGGIAGVVIGCLVAAGLLIAFLIWFLWKKIDQRQKLNAAMAAIDSDTPQQQHSHISERKKTRVQLEASPDLADTPPSHQHKIDGSERDGESAELQWSPSFVPSQLGKR